MISNRSLRRSWEGSRPGLGRHEDGKLHQNRQEAGKRSSHRPFMQVYVQHTEPFPGKEGCEDVLRRFVLELGRGGGIPCGLGGWRGRSRRRWRGWSCLGEAPFARVFAAGRGQSRPWLECLGLRAVCESMCRLTCEFARAIGLEPQGSRPLRHGWTPWHNPLRREAAGVIDPGPVA
jgi:hypothetical protein